MNLVKLLILSAVSLPVTVYAQSPSWTIGTSKEASAAYQAAFGRSNETTVGNYKYIAASSKLIWTGQGTAILVLAASNTDESHASSGTLGVIHLKSLANGFTVLRRWLEAGGGSTWGGAPEFSISSKIGPRPVVYTEGGGTWQGCTSGVASLIELTPSGPQSLAEFPAFYEPAEGRGTTGKVTNIRFGLSFDVVYSGSKRFVDKYARRGSKYLLASGPSKAETC
jgi:hypothetical protein